MKSTAAKNIVSDIAGVRVSYPRGQKAYVAAAIRLADDGGTIQATDMLDLSSDPTKHTASSLTDVLASVGATIID